MIILSTTIIYFVFLTVVINDENLEIKCQHLLAGQYKLWHLNKTHLSTNVRDNMQFYI